MKHNTIKFHQRIR